MAVPENPGDMAWRRRKSRCLHIPGSNLALRMAKFGRGAEISVVTACLRTQLQHALWNTLHLVVVEPVTASRVGEQLPTPARVYNVHG